RAGSSGASTPRTALRELEDCRTQLERALEESHEHRRASDAREAAQAAQARALALKPARRRLKAPSRTIDDAENAFKARRWTKAREGYVHATEALIALERELAGGAAVARAPERARVAPGPAAAPAEGWSEAPTVGVSRAPARVAPPRPRQPWLVPGAAAAALVLALVVARVSGLWSPAAQRSTQTAATPAPAREAPEVSVKQRPAPAAPPLEAPVPSAVAEAPIAALPAPTAAVAPRPVESAPPAVAALPPPTVPRIARFTPREDLVPVPAGAIRTFALELAPGAGSKPSIEWRLDGSVVARDVTEWKFQARPSASGAPQELQARVGDGTGEDQLHLWKISVEPLPPPKLEPLKLEWRPERLDRLPYQQAQEFELIAPPGSAAGLDYSWTIDGRQVASGPRFSLPNADARLAGRGPVEVAALARDASGRTFSHKWSFRVDPPPAPELTGSTPSAGTVSADQGATLSFELAAAAPAPGQALSYVFEVDRKPSSSQSPRLPYTLNDESEHTIVGYIEDNFRQRSKRQATWKIPASSGIVTKVQSWLADYERAWNSQDSRRLASLRGMSTADADKLQETLAQQKGLKVSFSDIRIQKIDARTAKATYSRTDEFDSVPMGGEHVKRTRPVEQTFTLDGGVVRPQWERKE
ncbi:MAG TPA: hypothetical protein VEI94_10890, partial [Candidatus Bathyarchaeia archaeon]|nr:hypothetical protein [Candidatus Bathyarchaeia archaeon]